MGRAETTMTAAGVEEQVLGALLSAPSLADDAARGVGPEHFSTIGRGVLFAALVRAAEAAGGEPIELDALADSLADPAVADAAARAEALELLARLIEHGILGHGAGGPDERFRFNLKRVREMAEIRGALATAPASVGAALPTALDQEAPDRAPRPGTDDSVPLEDIEARLRLIKRLHDEGLITDEELAAKRQQLLDAI